MRIIIKAGLRLVLILNFLSAVTIMVTGLVNNSVSGRYFTSVPIYLLAFLIIFSVLAVLWWKSDSIVRFVAGNVDDTQLAVTTSNTDLIKLVVRILGLILIVTALPPLAGALAYDLIPAGGDPNVFRQQPLQVRQYVASGVQILLGAWLLFGSAEVVKKISDAWEHGP